MGLGRAHPMSHWLLHRFTIQKRCGGSDVLSEHLDRLLVFLWAGFFFIDLIFRHGTALKQQHVRLCVCVAVGGFTRLGP